MKNGIISEDQIRNVLSVILNEETSKVKREDYNRLQFKLDELENSLNETIKELEKVKNSIPDGLKTITNGRINGITSNLSNAKQLTIVLKNKIKVHKKSAYAHQIDEKKKK